MPSMTQIRRHRREPRNPNIKPTRKRKVAKEKLPISATVRRRDGGDQCSEQQSMQLRQRKQASGSQGPSQSQTSEVAQASHSQPSQAAHASQSQPSQAALNPNHLKQLRLLKHVIHLNLPNYLENNNIRGG
ncbi:unnamed protein product [Prunus armeniaca]